SLKPLKQEQAPAPVAAPQKRGWGRLLVGAFVTLAVFGVLLGAYYIYVWHSAAPAPTPQSAAATAAQTAPAASAPAAATSTAQGCDQTAQIIAEVGALIELPQGETPTVATVTDPSKLAGQT